VEERGSKGTSRKNWGFFCNVGRPGKSRAIKTLWDTCESWVMTKEASDKTT